MNIKLEDIEEKARHDDLTGVYNRRALMVAMEEAKQRADATGEPLSICVIDLDLFKRYNDEFDHLTGDQVLRAFAQAVQDGLRSTDIFGRYGGEEFVQILPHSDAGGRDGRCRAAAQANQRARHSNRALDRSVDRIDRRGAVQAGRRPSSRPSRGPIQRCTRRNNWAETVWNADASQAQG